MSVYRILTWALRPFTTRKSLLCTRDTLTSNYSEDYSTMGLVMRVYKQKRSLVRSAGISATCCREWKSDWIVVFGSLDHTRRFCHTVVTSDIIAPVKLTQHVALCKLTFWFRIARIWKVCNSSYCEYSFTLMPMFQNRYEMFISWTWNMWSNSRV